MSSEVLLTTPNHRIVHHRPERSRKTRVLITFGANGLADTGRWTDLAVARGHETIHVSSASAYQGLGVEEFVAAVAPVLEGRKVIACGSGVGGFAAIFYGSALQSQIIALSPRHEGPGGEALVEAKVNSGNVTVLFDPADAAAQALVGDWVQPAYPGAQVLPVFMTGTDTAQALDSAGQLVPFLEKSLNGYVPKKVKQVFPPSSAKGLWAQGLALWFGGDTKKALDAMLKSARLAPEAGTLMDVAAKAQSVEDTEVLRTIASIVGEHGLWASMNGKTARLLLNAQKSGGASARG